jgi:hypothetical protein
MEKEEIPVTRFEVTKDVASRSKRRSRHTIFSLVEVMGCSEEADGNGEVVLGWR